MAAQLGLASVNFEGRQLVLRYPPLPEGVESRSLRDLDRGIISGKNAYRIQFREDDLEMWQARLIEVLLRLRKMG
jgi:transcription-repair coupling factor (superfamily II helicase)